VMGVGVSVMEGVAGGVGVMGVGVSVMEGVAGGVTVGDGVAVTVAVWAHTPFSMPGGLMNSTSKANRNTRGNDFPWRLE
jgi:hypothetical protein